MFTNYWVGIYPLAQVMSFQTIPTQFDWFCSPISFPSVATWLTVAWPIRWHLRGISETLNQSVVGESWGSGAGWILGAWGAEEGWVLENLAYDTHRAPYVRKWKERREPGCLYPWFLFLRQRCQVAQLCRTLQPLTKQTQPSGSRMLTTYHKTAQNRCICMQMCWILLAQFICALYTQIKSPSLFRTAWSEIYPLLFVACLVIQYCD